MDASDNLFQPIALIILMTKSIELSDQMGIVVYLEARIDTNLELLVHGRVPEGKSHHRNAGRWAEIEGFTGQNYSARIN